MIPKDTIVFINIWGLNNIPASLDTSESPMSEFGPDRYKNRTKLASYYAASPDFSSRDHYVYGAGRRLCPGIHLAERSLFVAVAKLLCAFEFRERLDAPVNVDPRTGYMNGAVRVPKNFKCEVLVRPNRQDVIEKEFANVRELLAEFEA